MSAPPSVAVPSIGRYVSMQGGAGAGRSTHVNLAILEALLQVVVDGLVGDFADQRQIRDAHLLLLGGLEDGLGGELGRLLARASSWCTASILLAPGALCLALQVISVSVCRVTGASVGGRGRLVPWLMPDRELRCVGCLASLAVVCTAGLKCTAGDGAGYGANEGKV